MFDCNESLNCFCFAECLGKFVGLEEGMSWVPFGVRCSCCCWPINSVLTQKHINIVCCGIKLIIYALYVCVWDKYK